jgi:hypothetical protein
VNKPLHGEVSGSAVDQARLTHFNPWNRADLDCQNNEVKVK